MQPSRLGTQQHMERCRSLHLQQLGWELPTLKISKTACSMLCTAVISRHLLVAALAGRLLYHSAQETSAPQVGPDLTNATNRRDTAFRRIAVPSLLRQEEFWMKVRVHMQRP
jgi:hypothetical protein